MASGVRLWRGAKRPRETRLNLELSAEGHERMTELDQAVAIVKRDLMLSANISLGQKAARLKFLVMIQVELQRSMCEQFEIQSPLDPPLALLLVAMRMFGELGAEERFTSQVARCAWNAGREDKTDEALLKYVELLAAGPMNRKQWSE